MSVPVRLGEYAVLGRIGIGSTAEILLAERRGVRVALKRLHPHLRDDEEVWRAFVGEARLLCLMSHPNIVRVIDLLEDGSETFMVLELVDGPSLAGLQRRATERRIIISVETVLNVVRSVAAALDIVHNARDAETDSPLSMVHRDIAPANVLISRDGRVVLTDFGIVRSRQAKKLGILSSATTTTGMLKGRRAYASPEQVTGGVLDARSDLYSLGVVAWEMLAGRRMHAETNPLSLIEAIVHGTPAPSTSLRAELAQPIAELIDQLIAKQPEARPGSAAEVVARLDAELRARDLAAPTQHFIEALALPSLTAAPAPQSGP
jgi:serine/threonine-protein kinase